MTTIIAQLQQFTATAVQQLFQANIPAGDIQVQLTRREFTGELTIVVFPFVRFARLSPEATADKLGTQLLSLWPALDSFNVIKGFLNLSFTASFLTDTIAAIYSDEAYGEAEPTGQTIVLEYCGPNTNKPLHLGHIRNVVLGYSMAEILGAAGHDVHKVNIYNDRGIAICKSMVAWQLFGNGETPPSSGIKGDHLIGKYYVAFAREHDKQVNELVEQGMDKEAAKKQAPIQQAAQQMLQQWEAGDAGVMNLWRTMNGWVYEGFNETYDKLGIDFEKNYYESETWTVGKQMVEEGLASGVCYRKEDGSVWIDLEAEGLDQKVLLRSDGTSVYLTQDLGTAEKRYEDYHMDRSIYVVANEQEYHFKALQATLEKMGKPFAAGIYHLSYGMVDLPSGKMKSREGTTVDADDLYAEMLATAETTTRELGKSDGLAPEEAAHLYRMIGLGALKYFLLRVHPKKRILFDPQESIDFQGDTGPFLQYTHARIRSVERKWVAAGSNTAVCTGTLSDLERELAMQLYRYPEIVQEAARDYDPSHVANYAFNLAKTYNRFYADHPILNAPDTGTQFFRVQLSVVTARIIRKSMALLGINVPEVM